MVANELKDETKNGVNARSLELVEVVLVQWNLLNNQKQRKFEVLYAFTRSRSYASLLNVEPSNLTFLKTCNTEYHKIIIIFTNLNGKPLEIEGKINLILSINKYKWHVIYRTKNKKIY